MMDKVMEKRIIKDENGFYQVQIRFLPLEDWEPADGWRTILVSSIYENAVEILNGIGGEIKQ